MLTLYTALRADAQRRKYGVFDRHQFGGSEMSTCTPPKSATENNSGLVWSWNVDAGKFEWKAPPATDG